MYIKYKSPEIISVDELPCVYNLRKVWLAWVTNRGPCQHSRHLVFSPLVMTDGQTRYSQWHHSAYEVHSWSMTPVSCLSSCLSTLTWSFEFLMFFGSIHYLQPVTLHCEDDGLCRQFRSADRMSVLERHVRELEQLQLHRQITAGSSGENEPAWPSDEWHSPTLSLSW